MLDKLNNINCVCKKGFYEKLEIYLDPVCYSCDFRCDTCSDNTACT